MIKSRNFYKNSFIVSSMLIFYMGSIGKSFALVLILIMIVSSLTLKGFNPLVKAQTQNGNSTIIVPNQFNNVTILNVTIQSPENRTYNENNVTLSFTIESNAPPKEFAPAALFALYLIHGVALDYDTANLIHLIENTNLFDEFPEDVSVKYSKMGNNLYSGSGILTDLSQGKHNVTIWTEADTSMISYGMVAGYSFTTVSFNVDSIPPKVSILSPQVETYNSSDVPLDFTVNKTTSEISYNLDGHGNITATGNLTLTGLSNGNHNIPVYAIDEAGNVGSQAVDFTVALPTVKSEGFLSAIIIAVSTIAVFVALSSLLVYRRHRKTSNEKATHVV